MRQDLIDFIRGFSDAMIHGLQNDRTHGCGKEIPEEIKDKIFTIAISIVLTSVGMFAVVWGIAFTTVAK